MVLALVAIVGVVAAFWFGVLAPKRKEASDLKTQVGQLQSQLSDQQQTIASAQQARSSFAADYHKLVVLGKAVPGDSDQASLLVQLNALAQRAGVSFQSLSLDQAAAGAAPTTSAPPTTDTTSTDTTSTDTTSTDASAAGSETTPTDATPAPGGVDAPSTTATETSAAMLPLGAAIGPAGLPVMPYQLTFTGGYFQISKFLRSVDSLVHTRHGGVTVSGRLVTVNSFDLTPEQSTSTTGAATASASKLEAQLSVTTYVSPADQGLTGGATPTGPAPVTPSTSVPTSAPVSSSP
jgi:Tfp pilus assembly protein PilO